MFRQNPIAYLTAKMWKYSESGRKKIILFSAMSVAANLVGLTHPLIVALILNEIQKRGVTKQNLGWLFVIMSFWVLRELVTWVLHGPSRVMECCNAFEAKVSYKMYLLSGIFNLPLEWHANHHTGDTNDKQAKGTNALFDYSSMFFIVLTSAVRLFGSLVFLFYFDVVSGFVAFGSLVVALAIMARMDKILVERYKKLNRADNVISEKIQDAINNIVTVIVLRADTQFLKSIRKKMMEPFELFRKNSKLNEWKWFTAAMFTKIAALAIVGVYLTRLALSGESAQIGTISALIGYTENFAGLFFYFASTYGDILRQRASVANSEELSQEFVSREKAFKFNGWSRWKELEVKNVSFSYSGDNGDNGTGRIEDISFKMKRGDKIAFVGETGSGKTTVLQLVRDLYSFDKGTILLDGKELSGGFKEISASIALLPQKPENFSTSILENITMGIDYDLDGVVKFSKMARFHDVVEKLPRKYESFIREKGVNLSGGEQQRLALARGLLACEDKTIVLLDEPTSSVDSTTEWDIFQNIFREFQDKTIISSIHGLHLLPLFDFVYLFASGKIIASGPFNELLASSPVFKDMWLKCQARPG